MATSAAADDLDAFFDEVSEVEAKAKEEQQEEPPRKKLKRPLGVVVAAAGSKVVAAKQQQEETNSHDAASSSTNGNVIRSSIAVTKALQPPQTSTTQQQPKKQQVPDKQQQQQQSSFTRRFAAGKAWVDPTLDEWPANDYRIFCGNLAKDVTNESLHDHFKAKYPSVAMARVIRDSSTDTSKGFGFVSFLEPMECAAALREMDQTWLSSRPIRVKRSDWKDRDFKQVVKKQKKESRRKKKHY